MGEGLKKLSGSKLEQILGKLTSNKAMGFLLGFAVTAIIQSSSATTVILFPFCKGFETHDYLMHVKKDGENEYFSQLE